MDSNIVQDELEKTLTDEVARWAAAPYQAGLFTNDLDDTDREHTIADITPCAGAGYTGLQDVSGPSAPAWDGTWWSSTFDDILWTFDGSATRTIRGVYVVDETGELVAWRKFAGAGITVGFFAGQTFISTITRKRSSSP